MKTLAYWLTGAMVVMGTADLGRGADGIEAGATADYFTRYIWRGQNLNDDSVFQPSAYVGTHGFTGSIWGSFDLTDDNDNDHNFTEVDLTADYTAAVPVVPHVDFSVGAIHYIFPNTDFDATTEVYAGLTTSVWLSPAFQVYYDVDEIEGAYFQFSLGHTIEKIAKWREDCYCNVEVGASLGYGTAAYNEGYFDVDGGRLNDVTLTAALPICLGKWTIKPSIACSTMLDVDIRAATERSDNLWAGISASFDF